MRRQKALGVVLLNADYYPLEMITWQRAVNLIVSNEATSLVDEPGEFIHSKSLTVAKPRTVLLRRYVDVRHDIVVDEHSTATMTQILRRDKNKCGYCGGFADTVDHIYPKSRGGLNTWGNLIAACFEHNQLKEDRTPEEAGMKLLWPPRAPESYDKKLQKTIWQAAVSESSQNVMIE